MYELRLHHQARSNGNRDHRATRQERALASIDMRYKSTEFCTNYSSAGQTGRRGIIWPVWAAELCGAGLDEKKSRLMMLPACGTYSKWVAHRYRVAQEVF